MKITLDAMTGAQRKALERIARKHGTTAEKKLMNANKILAGKGVALHTASKNYL